MNNFCLCIDRLESAIPLLEHELEQLPEADSIAIAFPDDGAFKRFHQMFQERNTIICHKIRDGKKRIVKVKDGGYDMIVTGTTY